MVVQLADRLYEEAAQRAIAIGFPTVDEYVADVVQHDLHEETENIDYLFTPEFLEVTNAAADQVEAGKFHTSEQVQEHFDRKLAAWYQNGGR